MRRVKAGDRDDEAPTRARPYRPAEGRDPADEPCLEILGGRAKGRTVRLRAGRGEIGRAPSCLLRLDDEGVSRHHATVELGADGTVVIVDRGSTNGVYVNGERVHRIALREGDRVQIGPDVTLRLGYRSRAELAADETPPSRTADVPLSARELEIARLAVADLTNAEIGQKLDISPKTVKTHLRNIYERLGLHSRVALIRWLSRRGLSAPEE